ncbi:sugar ABC transporter substrate-binding protein [Vibrio penaeicida]|uniref:sugar ABC transporter substrate-binding protein n=1 Tax=Vibrio penaeicida TaxID=104609 RepID=UPI000CE9C542|nr:sugar ABC transporter substrate-binding protein [Vibrio penaeicida]
MKKRINKGVSESDTPKTEPVTHESVTHGASDDLSPIGLSRRRMMQLSMGTAVAVATMGPATFRPAMAASGKKLKFAAALGWTAFDSGAALHQGYKDAVEQLGGELTITDAGFDPKKQTENIDAFITSKPDALFITPADAAAIAPAVQRALDAGIPVFAGDSQVPGVAVHSTAMSSNYSMGWFTAEWLAEQMGGKGKIAIVTLPQNESWDQRTLGMEWALRQYPGIEVVAKWAFNFNASTTPRQAVDNMLTARDDLDAIWCAWDGAAIEGALAVRAAGRKNIFLTGIDGGPQSFGYISGGSAFKMSCAQSFYEMAFSNVFYAHEYAAGRNIPRLVITPCYKATENTLQGLGEKAADYDRPGRAKELGWVRVV